MTTDLIRFLVPPGYDFCRECHYLSLLNVDDLCADCANLATFKESTLADWDRAELVDAICHIATVFRGVMAGDIVTREQQTALDALDAALHIKKQPDQQEMNHADEP